MDCCFPEPPRYTADEIQKIKDLIMAVNIHESLRAQHGAGNSALLDSRYLNAHSIMSKLARDLSDHSSDLPIEELMEEYKELPEHIGYNVTIVGSC